MKRKIIITILLVLIIIHPIYLLFANSSQFFSPGYSTRYSSLKKLYESSQYMIKKKPVIITDEALESYLAGAFLKGGDPILYIHDHPPLGKYILSSSIFIFDNENTIIPILFVLSLLGIYLVSRIVIKDQVLALVPVVLFSNEPLMYDKLVYTPNIELVQLPFIVFAIYFFLKMIENKKIYTWAILASLSLGFVISIRYFVLGGVLLFSQFAFLVFKKRFTLLMQYTFTLPLTLIILFFSYTRTVLDTHSLIKPFSVQKYILAYHSSMFVLPFTVWDLILFNRWHTWWGNNGIVSDPNWLITWPVSLILSVVLGIGALFKKIKIRDSEIVILFWILSYGAMLSVGMVSVRYFICWVPFFYILALSFIGRSKAIKKLIT